MTFSPLSISTLITANSLEQTSSKWVNYSFPKEGKLLLPVSYGSHTWRWIADLALDLFDYFCPGLKATFIFHQIKGKLSAMASADLEPDEVLKRHMRVRIAQWHSHSTPAYALAKLIDPIAVKILTDQAPPSKLNPKSWLSFPIQKSRVHSKEMSAKEMSAKEMSDSAIFKLYDDYLLISQNQNQGQNSGENSRQTLSQSPAQKKLLQELPRLWQEYSKSPYSLAKALDQLKPDQRPLFYSLLLDCDQQYKSSLSAISLNHLVEIVKKLPDSTKGDLSITLEQSLASLLSSFQALTPLQQKALCQRLLRLHGCHQKAIGVWLDKSQKSPNQLKIVHVCLSLETLADSHWARCYDLLLESFNQVTVSHSPSKGGALHWRKEMTSALLPQPFKKLFFTKGADSQLTCSDTQFYWLCHFNHVRDDFWTSLNSIASSNKPLARALFRLIVSLPLSLQKESDSLSLALLANWKTLSLPKEQSEQAEKDFPLFLNQVWKCLCPTSARFFLASASLADNPPSHSLKIAAFYTALTEELTERIKGYHSPYQKGISSFFLPFFLNGLNLEQATNLLSRGYGRHPLNGPKLGTLTLSLKDLAFAPKLTPSKSPKSAKALFKQDFHRKGKSCCLKIQATDEDPTTYLFCPAKDLASKETTLTSDPLKEAQYKRYIESISALIEKRVFSNEQLAATYYCLSANSTVYFLMMAQIIGKPLSEHGGYEFELSKLFGYSLLLEIKTPKEGIGGGHARMKIEIDVLGHARVIEFSVSDSNVNAITPLKTG